MKTILAAALTFALALPLCATEPNPSADQRAAVLRLLTAMNMDDTMRSTIDLVYRNMEQQLFPDADDPEAKETFGYFRERVAKLDLGSDLREAYVRIYAKYFTTAEIDAITAFYLSNVGRKMVAVQSHMMQEAMQVGMEQIGPKLEQALHEAREEADRKRPWRRTSQDMRSVATAVEAYAVDTDEYPAGDYASLKEVLVPTYIRELPEKDMWNHPYAYVASDDRKHYRLVSAGADTIFEWDSRRIAALKEDAEIATSYRDRLEDDLIFQDGSFLQLPVQLKPAPEE